MGKRHIFIANWKMNMPFNRALEYIEHNKNVLSSLAARDNKKIVFCPSFLALDRLASPLKSLGIALGAQNCSEHERGSYTGEIDALSLYQIGCHYCIVGHSERRLYYGETDEIVAHKTLQLIINNIIPIICIGESKEAYEKEKTIHVLKQQLRFVFEVLALHAQDLPVCYIAYEPIWAIGTGITPENQYLAEIVTWLWHEITAHKLPVPVYILYGGSVDALYARHIAQMPLIEGFLIGSASLDFQKLVNIVLLE